MVNVMEHKAFASYNFEPGFTRPSGAGCALATPLFTRMVTFDGTEVTLKRFAHVQVIKNGRSWLN